MCHRVSKNSVHCRIDLREHWHALDTHTTDYNKLTALHLTLEWSNGRLDLHRFTFNKINKLLCRARKQNILLCIRYIKLFFLINLIYF